MFFSLIQIQESVLLNKQWILMNGMSDTSLDSELLCRLRALDQISFRSNPNIQRDSYVNKLHHTTFWKMGMYLQNQYVMHMHLSYSLI